MPTHMTNEHSEPRLDHSVIDQVRELSAVRPGLLVSLVETFGRNTALMLSETTGRLEEGDFENLRVSFHSLKGTAASLGARRLSVLAGSVEYALAHCASLGELEGLILLVRNEFGPVHEALLHEAALTPDKGPLLSRPGGLTATVG